AEEMRHELGRQLADAVAAERALEHEVGAAAEVERDLGGRLVHRQQEAVAADPALVAEGLPQRRADREGDILDRVMRVEARSAVAADRPREPAVLAELLEHVIE